MVILFDKQFTENESKQIKEYLKKRCRTYTWDEIESKKTQKGGWTKEQFKEWGEDWPPTKGWKKRLIGK